MGFLYERNTGNRVYIPVERQLEAWRSGNYALPGGQKVNVVRGDGKMTVAVDPEHLDQMLDRGWHLEGTEELKGRRAREMYGDMEGRAFGAGAARGLTFGLSDMVLTGLDIAEPETLDALRMANPSATTAGEVTGMVGGALLPMGAAARGTTLLSKALRGAAQTTAKTPAALVSRLGGHVGRTVEQALLPAAVKEGAKASLARQALARTAGYAVGGAAEGAIYGTGRYITEEALGDVDSVGEALTTYIGPEALLGGIVGGAFGSASKLGGAGYRKIVEKFVKSGDRAQRALDGFVQKQIFKDTLHLTDADLAKAGADQVNEFRNVLFDPSILPDGAIIQPGVKGKEVAPRLKRAVDYHGKLTGGMYENVDNLATAAAVDLTDVPQAANIEEKIKDAWVEAKRSLDPEGEKIAKALENFELKLSAETTGPMSFAEAWNHKVEIAKKVPWKQKARADWTPDQEARAIIAEAINDEVTRAMDATLAKVPDALPGATLTDMQILKNQFLKSKKVYATIANFAKTASRRAKLEDELGDMLSGFSGTAARSTLFRLLSGARTASAVRSGVGMGAIGAVGEVAKEATGTGGFMQWADKTSRLGGIQRGVDEIQKKADKVAKGIFETTRRASVPASVGIFRGMTKEKDRKRAAEKFARQLQQQAANPEELAQQMAANVQGLEEVAPNVAKAMGMTMARAIQVLLERAPKYQPLDDLQPLREDLIQSSPQLREFERAVATVMHPETFFEAVEEGTISPEMVQLFRQVYPKMYETLVMRIREEVAQSKTRLPRERRKVLDVLMGGTATLNPGAVHRAQQVYADAQPQEEQQMAQGKGVSGISITGLDKVHNLKGSRQSGMQRLEARRV